MLTQDQIKGLKKGDPIVIHTKLHHVDSAGDIWFDAPVRNNDGRLDFISPDCVSLPSEPGTSAPTKNDPTRLFKEGDKVRVVEWNGRHFHDRDHGTELTTGCICEVCDDEESTVTEGYINIMVTYEEQVRSIAPCFLELVTPVEELEPYTVDECGFAPTLYVRKNGKVYMTIPYKEGSSLFQTREEALAAAEAECKRLNEEYRKEMEK